MKLVVVLFDKDNKVILLGFSAFPEMTGSFFIEELKEVVFSTFSCAITLFLVGN